MPYCHHCWTKNEEDSEFCKRCGKKLGESIEKEEPIKESEENHRQEIIEEIPEKKKGKKGIIIGGVIIIIIVAIFLFIRYNPNILGEVIGGNAKEECPYECCLDGKYYEKICETYYECSKNFCVPKDTDGDKLTDLEEIEIGTDINSYDTDGDTWSDYKEYKEVGTNPLKKNTDKDRYDDNEDPSPLEVNSAEINMEVIKNEGYWNEELKTKLLPVLGCLVLYGAEASFGEVTGFIASACSYLVTGTSIATLIKEDISYRDVEISIENSGDDYTSYVKSQMNVYVKYENNPKELFNSSEISLGRLNPGKSQIDKITYTFKVEDYTIKLLKNILEGKTGDKEYIFEFENLDYEKF